MDTSPLLFLIFVVITTSECSETAEPSCRGFRRESFNLNEGESLYFVPRTLRGSNCSGEEFTWYKNNSQIEYISTDKNERVHYQGCVLFLLNLLTEDSGFYTARCKMPSGKCSNYHVKVEVFKASHRNTTRDEAFLYGGISNSDQNKKIRCPDPVSFTCDALKGELTWYKDAKLLPGHHGDDLWVSNATKEHEGIYTCICTWTYNLKVYKSSGSRRLTVKDRVVHRTVPDILSPTNKEQFADKGLEIKLNCSVFCGTNVPRDCHASWHVNGKPFSQTDGYNQTTQIINRKKTISTATLTIEKVSAKDFQTEFKCVGEGFYETASYTLTLKRRVSIIPLVIGGVCMLVFCVFTVALVKCFAIDLALFFRPYLPLSSHNKEARVYDAYVVYQTQSMDEAAEDTLCQFVTKNLPSVLEEKCGYQLFIHGRDDIPGEDRLELVDDCMKQSRRLMVILTPGSGSGAETTDQLPASPQNSVIGGFDWQVGLHHALVQREMSVILIQLGDTGPQGYTHLPPGLQHLIRKSAPIRWPEGSRDATARNSCFWKRVRYLMPATPAKRRPQSAVI